MGWKVEESRRSWRKVGGEAAAADVDDAAGAATAVDVVVGAFEMEGGV